MQSGNTLNFFMGFCLIVIIAGSVYFQWRRYRHGRDEAAKAEGLHRRKNQKLTLARALSSELKENRFKCESFITVYTELLQNLRETEQKASYEQTGGFVHRHLPLSRGVFDANQENLPLLSLKIAGSLTALYAHIHSEAEYFTLEPTLPRTHAIRNIETVLEETQKILDPIDAINAALKIIIRDGSKNEGNGE